MINLRFGARAQPLNPIVWKKANRVYRWLTTFSPSAINRYFMEDSSGDTYILCGLSPRYGHLSGGSSDIQKDFLALDFYLNLFFLSFFLLFNKRILLTQTRQFRVLFFVVEDFYLFKTLNLRGKTCQLAVLTLNNSPIIRSVALKCGSAWELVISVTLNSVQQTTVNVCALR